MLGIGLSNGKRSRTYGTGVMFPFLKDLSSHGNQVHRLSIWGTCRHSRRAHPLCRESIERRGYRLNPLTHRQPHDTHSDLALATGSGADRLALIDTDLTIIVAHSGSQSDQNRAGYATICQILSTMRRCRAPSFSSHHLCHEPPRANSPKRPTAPSGTLPADERVVFYS
jgi:hypothetical protein